VWCEQYLGALALTYIVQGGVQLSLPTKSGRVKVGWSKFSFKKRTKTHYRIIWIHKNTLSHLGQNLGYLITGQAYRTLQSPTLWFSPKEMYFNNFLLQKRIK